MTDNYFSIERAGKCHDNVVFRDNNEDLVFEDLMNMSCGEAQTYDNIDMFVECVMDVSNQLFGSDDDQTIITLIGKDSVFIWSMIVGVGDDKEELKYVFVDWKKDGRSYRYEKEN